MNSSDSAPKWGLIQVYTDMLVVVLFFFLMFRNCLAHAYRLTHARASGGDTPSERREPKRGECAEMANDPMRLDNNSVADRGVVVCVEIMF